MSGTVLVVDDEADLLEIVRTYLEDAGYQVYTAGDGKEGLKLVQEIKPHLILLDISMPYGMGGFQMLEALRRKPEIAQTPVIMLTAQGQSANIFEAQQFQAVDFLIKPFSQEELLEVVHRVI